MTTEGIGTALSTVGTVFNQVVTWISGNDLLTVFLVAGLVPCGIGIFARLKRAVK